MKKVVLTKGLNKDQLRALDKQYPDCSESFFQTYGHHGAVFLHGFHSSGHSWSSEEYARECEGVVLVRPKFEVTTLYDVVGEIEEAPNYITHNGRKYKLVKE